jgi:polyisoprenoid-binding protein YceI
MGSGGIFFAIFRIHSGWLTKLAPMVTNAFTPSKLLMGGLLWGMLAVGSIASAADLSALPLDSKGSSLKFFCESFMHNFHGEAQEISGNAQVNLKAAPPVQSATLHFKTAALTTFIKARDEKMFDWLHVQAHPDAVFQLQSVKLVNGDYKQADAQHPAEFKVAGTLTLNGVEQPITGTAKGWRENDRLVVSGDTVVDTLSYGLPQIRMAVLTVGTDVKTSYIFRFVLPPEYAKK